MVLNWFVGEIEFALQTARSFFRGVGAPTLPGPLNDGDLLTQAEEANEVLPPWWSRCAVEAKAAETEAEERLDRNPEVKKHLAAAAARMDQAVKVYLCDNCGKALGDICTVSRVLQGMFCSTRCLSVAEVRSAMAELRANPPTETPVAMQGAGEDPPRGAEAAPRGADSPPDWKVSTGPIVALPWSEELEREREQWQAIVNDWADAYAKQGRELDALKRKRRRRS